MTALLLTLTAFAIMLALARLKVPLALAIIIGSVALGGFFHLPFLTILATLGAGVIKPMSLALLLIVALLLAISEAMRLTGRLEAIVTLARTIFRRPVITMAALPALIGLLPMPAGAIFSAPMVAAAAEGGDGEKVDGARLSAINYWWRHIWEHWWPLYPGVILAISLTGSSLPAFILYQLPLGLVMILSGSLLLRRLPAGLWTPALSQPGTALFQLLRATAGIWIILAVWGMGAIGATLLFRLFPPPSTSAYLTAAINTTRELGPLLLGMVVSLIWVMRTPTLPRGFFRQLVRQSSVLPLLGIIVSVMVFQSMLEQAGAARQIAQEMSALRIPVLLVIIVLPAVAGLVTGVAFGFVGVSFPIVIELIRALPDHPELRPYTIIAYACGHLGMMISPLHLCYIVSNRYFQTTFGAVYRLLAWPLAVTALLAAGYGAVLLTLWR